MVLKLLQQRLACYLPASELGTPLPITSLHVCAPQCPFVLFAVLLARLPSRYCLQPRWKLLAREAPVRKCDSGDTLEARSLMTSLRVDARGHYGHLDALCRFTALLGQLRLQS